jgi:hypothetical protein
MFRDGDHGVAAVLVDLEVIDALNSVKPLERKPVFTLMEIKDDIVAECPIGSVEEPATEAERIVAASAVKAIVASLGKLDRLLSDFGVMGSGFRRPVPQSRSRATPFPVCGCCERTGRSRDRAAASPARYRDAARIAGATRSLPWC